MASNLLAMASNPIAGGRTEASTHGVSTQRILELPTWHNKGTLRGRKRMELFCYQLPPRCMVIRKVENCSDVSCATSNKCLATSNKCLTSSNKKLLVTSNKGHRY